MKLRSVLLDRGFITALLDPADRAHTASLGVYGALVESYQAGEDRLVALSTVLSQYPNGVRKGALAPVATTWVSRRHLAVATSIDSVRPELALTLVMLRREGIGAIATTLHDFERFDVEVLLATAVNS